MKIGKIWTRNGPVEPPIQYAAGGGAFIDDDPVSALNVPAVTSEVSA